MFEYVSPTRIFYRVLQKSSEDVSLSYDYNKYIQCTELLKYNLP